MHSWSLNYLWLKLVATAIRTVLSPLVMISILTKERMVDGVVKTKMTIPSREKGRTIKIHIYRPKDVPKESKLPVHINLHGSAFILPMHGADQRFCSYLSKRMGIAVIDSDYSKAPERPFPLGLEDVEDVVLWCHSRSREFDLTKGVSCGGHSAGANLALAASYVLGPKIIRSVAVLYPPTDFLIRATPRAAPNPNYESGVALSVKAARFFNHCYLVDGADREDPKLTLTIAASEGMERFSKHIFVACGDGDLLFNDGERFVRNLQESKHPDAVFMRVHGQGHGWEKMAKKNTDAERQKWKAYDAIVDTIERGWKGDH